MGCVSIPTLIAAAGVGTEIYGASQQGSASNAANAANQANVTQANNESWTNYLMARGLNPGGTVPFGTIPTNAAAVNTKLPLWATVNVPTQFAGPGGSSGGGSGSPSTGMGGGGSQAAPGGYAPRGASPIGGSSGINTIGASGGAPYFGQTQSFSQSQAPIPIGVSY